MVVVARPGVWIWNGLGPAGRYTRGLHCDDDIITDLIAYERRFNKALLKRMMPMIEVWVKRAVRERKSQVLCILWAHLA